MSAIQLRVGMPYSGLAGVAGLTGLAGRSGYPEEDDMDLDDRVAALEKASIVNAARQDRHEEVCALRYEIIKKGNDQIAGYIKYLAISVGALALVVFGVATLQDLVRSGAGRIGVTVQAAPAPPAATR